MLDGVRAGLAGTNSDRAFDVGNKNLAIADSAGLRRRAYGLDGALHGVVRKNDLDFNFRQEINDIFGAAIELRVPFLSAKPFASVTVIPWRPAACSASFTSSSLNGLMIASTFFIKSPARLA